MKRYFAIILSILITFLSFPNQAYASDHGLSFGGIEVDIDVFAKDEQGNRTEPDSVLYLGQPTSYIIQVTNRYNASWVRVKIDSVLNNEKHIEISPRLNNGWIKRGDYYYYTEPLSYKEDVVMCEYIQLNPDQAVEGTISLKVSADAIQAENFMPDFDSEDPFRGVKIESSVQIDDEQWKQNMEQKQGLIHTVFDDATQSLIDDTELFKDTQILFPGASLQDSFHVQNESKKIMEISLFSGSEESYSPESKRILLEIKRDGQVIYYDSLLNEDIQQGITLATLSPNTTSQITFSIHVPEDVTNELIVQNIAVNWSFKTTEQSISPSNPSNSSDSSYSKSINGYMYGSPDLSLKTGIQDGTWILENEEKHWWKYQFHDGSFAADGWVFLHNPYYKNLSQYSWYHFDEKGHMESGWIRSDNDNWYFTHNISDGDLGTLVTGWHKDLDDGRQYYLDPISGIMQTGWKYIDNQYYYFARLQDTYKQNWFWDTTIGRWLYDKLGNRTYGSMYENEITPDGYRVNENGILQEKRL